MDWWGNTEPRKTVENTNDVHTYRRRLRRDISRDQSGLAVDIICQSHHMSLVLLDKREPADPLFPAQAIFEEVRPAIRPHQ